LKVSNQQIFVKEQLVQQILNGAEIILFDTAGRTQIDLQMMSEIKQIESVINPTETFLVADSVTGTSRCISC
jgi:signal recognition particle GTPase